MVEGIILARKKMSDSANLGFAHFGLRCAIVLPGQGWVAPHSFLAIH